MSLWTADCPRCGASKITFDVLAQLHFRTEHGWQHWFEIYAVCRACKRGTIFILSQQTRASSENFIKEPEGLVHKKEVALNHFFEDKGYIGLRHRAAQAPPDHLPPEIQKIVVEGATCLAVECWNAAGTMFRLCLDVATVRCSLKEKRPA
jgi:hypothetical protein